MRAGIALVLAVLAGGACRSTAPATPREIEAQLQRELPTVVRDEALTLYSPYDADATAEFASVAREEAALVRGALGAPVGAPVRLYLVAADASGDAPWLSASNGGYEGGAFAEGFAFAYVRASANGVALHAQLERDTLRHEFAHLYARRAGLARAKWFNEGLAREIEDMRVAGGVLRPHLFPPALVGARSAARPGALAQVLAWSNADELSTSERAGRYDLAQALLRFLVERGGPASWLERVRAAFALGDAELAALEPEWLAWFARLDALDELQQAARSNDGRERADAAALLPILAERGAAELATCAADEFALALLAERECSSAAATFLLFFRAQAVRPEDVATLAASPEPALALTAYALQAVRREPVDLEAARALWSRLSEPERARCYVQATRIRGLLERR